MSSFSINKKPEATRPTFSINTRPAEAMPTFSINTDSISPMFSISRKHDTRKPETSFSITRKARRVTPWSVGEHPEPRKYYPRPRNAPTADEIKWAIEFQGKLLEDKTTQLEKLKREHEIQLDQLKAKLREVNQQAPVEELGFENLSLADTVIDVEINM